jgi:hypothetical protein
VAVAVACLGVSPVLLRPSVSIPAALHAFYVLVLVPTQTVALPAVPVPFAVGQGADPRLSEVYVAFAAVAGPFHPMRARAGKGTPATAVLAVRVRPHLSARRPAGSGSAASGMGMM